VPLTVFTVALATPTVRLVFHRGNFSQHSAHLLAVTLAVYGASLVGSGVQRVLLAPFYARLDTRTPLRNTFYGVVVDLVLLVPCVLAFGLHSSNGLIGVAIAYSITQYYIVWHAGWRLRGWVDLKIGAIAGYVARFAVASAASIGVMLALVEQLHLDTKSGRMYLLVGTAGVAVAGVLTLGLVALILGLSLDRSIPDKTPDVPRRRRFGSGRHRKTDSARINV